MIKVHIIEVIDMLYLIDGHQCKDLQDITLRSVGLNDLPDSHDRTNQRESDPSYSYDNEVSDTLNFDSKLHIEVDASLVFKGFLRQFSEAI